MSIADELREIQHLANCSKWAPPFEVAAAIVREDRKPQVLPASDQVAITKDSINGQWIVIPISRGTGEEIMYLNFRGDSDVMAFHKVPSRSSIFQRVLSKVNEYRGGWWSLSENCLNIYFNNLTDVSSEEYQYHIESVWAKQMFARSKLGLPVCFYRVTNDSLGMEKY